VSTTDDSQRLNKVGLVLHNAAFYDLTVWLMTLGRERHFREALLDRARVSSGEAILDVGCGTGSLAIVAKRRAGALGRVSGVDASAEMLARAEKKARKARESVEFKQAPVQSLPFPDRLFDCATATVMMHHLSRKSRGECATEVLRVLKPSGRFLVIEFGASIGGHGPLRHFHRRGHVELGEIVQLLEGVGFKIDQRGQIGFRNMHFVLATKSIAA